MPVRHARSETLPSTLRPTWRSWQERFDQIPQGIGKQRHSHTRPRYVVDEDQGFGGFVTRSYVLTRLIPVD